MATARKGTKNKKVEQTETQTTLEYAKTVDVPSVIQDIANLQATTQSVLATLNSDLISRVQKVSTLDEAISLKEARLKELHGIENMAITLDEMAAQRAEDDKAHDKKVKEREEQWAEQDAARKKTLKREEEETKYAQQLEKRKWQDNFDAEKAKSEREEEDRKAALESSWNEREAALADSEDELTELRAQVEAFPTQLQEEIEKVTAGTIAAMNKSHEFDVAKLQQQLVSTSELYDQRIQSLEEKNGDLEETIKDLKEQLAQARIDAKEVTTSALTAVSGRDVASALQSVVNGKDVTKAGKGGQATQ